VRKLVVILFALIFQGFHAFCDGAEYRLVRIEATTNAVRVRLPLTDVTGKVRVKEKSSDGFGLPVAPSQTLLGKKHYLEWQIGYDIPNTNSPTVVPEIKFIRPARRNTATNFPRSSLKPSAAESFRRMNWSVKLRR